MKKLVGIQRPQRGMALILTMLIVLVMLVLVGSMLSIITGELSSVSFAGFDNRALYSADAGVQYAQQQIDNYAANNATPPPSSTWNQTLPADPSGKSATFTVVMDPTPYLRNGNLYYLVHSEGKAPGGGDRKVDAILEVQSYTHYAYYTYQNESGNYFVSGINSFDGPVYLQGTSNKLNFQWYNINKPIFLSTAIIAGNYGFSPSAPTTNSQWTQVIAGGSANITQTSTTGYVSYPPIGSTYIAANQAFNGTSGTSSLPTPATKDVYMNGALAKTGSGSLSSGIFVNGNVDSISGVVNGQYTIAVPDIQTSSTSNVSDIVVTGNITYKSDPTTGPSDDVLGMMCDNFNLGPASITPNVLKIQSDIIAGNSYEATHNQSDGGFGTVDSVGSLPLKTSVNIFGSLIQNEVKPLGQFNSGSGLLIKGWSDTYNYDTRQMTPPDWPTLGTGLVAWKDAGSPIY